MFSLKYLCLSTILFHGIITSEIQTLVGNADGFRPDQHKYLVKLDISYADLDYDVMGLCSGSIIDKKWVISAAHCFTDHVKKIRITQKIGSKNRVIGKGKQVVCHPDFIHDVIFNFNNAKNDIALVETKKPIQFNELTQPIGLARFGEFVQAGTIAGYGGDRNPRIPFEGTVDVYRCLPGIEMLCSYYIAYLEKGDSGGALTTDDGLIGISSAGTSEKGVTISAFVDISLHFKWILEVTGKDFTLQGPEITTS